jgi:hypothetical protein
MKAILATGSVLALFCGAFLAVGFAALTGFLAASLLICGCAFVTFFAALACFFCAIDDLR